MAILDRDPIGFYRYTFGNLGYDDKSTGFASASQCSDSSSSVCINGFGSRVKLQTALNIIATFEVLQVLCFVIALIRMRLFIYSSDHSASDSHLTASSYAIMVTNLPSTVSKEELLEHFSSLYQLETLDWRGRKPIMNVRPVSEIENTGEKIHLGTWIAEIVLHKRIGYLLHIFKSQELYMTNLRKYRAFSKRAKYFKNEKSHRKYERKIRAEELKISIISGDVLRKSGVILNFDIDENQALLDMQVSNLILSSEENKLGLKKNNLEEAVRQRSIYDSVEAPSNTAFICFQYNESFVRCISDYGRYNSFPLNFFYPKKLYLPKYPEHKLKVAVAPPPEQVIFENLQMSTKDQIFSRCFTSIITSLFLLITFIIVLQSAIARKDFDAKIPSDELCYKEIPSFFLPLNSSAGLNYDWSWERSKDSSIFEAADTFCANNVMGQAFSTKLVSLSNVYSVPYSNGACTSEKNFCPVPGSASFCPCIVSDNDLQCYGRNTDGTTKETPSFAASDIGACYCFGEMLKLFPDIDEISSPYLDVCSSYFEEFSTLLSITTLTAVVAVFLEICFGYISRLLVEWELHKSIEEAQSSLMSKVFFANYTINTVILLVAYGNSEKAESSSILKALQIFVGPHNDFTSAW